MTPAPTTSPGDPSLASAPPTPLPGGQLPPASPASDEVGARSATPIALKQLMSQRGVPEKVNKISFYTGHMGFRRRFIIEKNDPLAISQ